MVPAVRVVTVAFNLLRRNGEPFSVLAPSRIDPAADYSNLRRINQPCCSRISWDRPACARSSRTSRGVASLEMDDPYALAPLRQPTAGRAARWQDGLRNVRDLPLPTQLRYLI
jgi:hypothetical protein